MNKNVIIQYEDFTTSALVGADDADALLRHVGRGENYTYTPLSWVDAKPLSERVLIIGSKVVYIRVTDDTPF